MLRKIEAEKAARWLILLLLAVPFVYMPLGMISFELSKKANMVATAMAFCLLGFVIRGGRELLQGKKQVRWMAVSVLVFFLTTLVGQMLGFQSLLYYWLGIRNNLVYFIFFFGCILFLSETCREGFLKLFDVLFVANLVLTVYQFFSMGVKGTRLGGDYLGGIFGTVMGCNAYTNVFLVIVVTYSVLAYLNQRESLWRFLFKCGGALLIAAMAELKVFFIEFAAILALVVLTTKFSWKKVALVAGGCVGMLVAIRLLTLIFPWWEGWFNLESIWKTVTRKSGYTGNGGMNRLTTVPIILSQFLQTWPRKLFGFGLGNCDAGPISAYVTPFYSEHYESQYTWFSSGILTMETGLVGLVTYLAFFAVVYFAAHSKERSGEGDPVFCQFTKILSLICLLLFLYNSTLRSEVGYMVYFALSMAFWENRSQSGQRK